MADINQSIYLKKNLPKTTSVLEVGSKDYGDSQNFRAFFDCDYTGLDLEAGKGVDVVHDLTTGSGKLGQFGFVICCSVLEHTKNPFKAAKTLAKLVKPGGCMYIATPWIQRYHGKYPPDDYWRFTLPGMRLLFDEMELKNAYLSTFTKGEFFSLDENPSAGNHLSKLCDGRKYLPCFELHVMAYKQ